MKACAPQQGWMLKFRLSEVGEILLSLVTDCPFTCFPARWVGTTCLWGRSIHWQQHQKKKFSSLVKPKQRKKKRERQQKTENPRGKGDINNEHVWHQPNQSRGAESSTPVPSIYTLSCKGWGRKSVQGALHWNDSSYIWSIQIKLVNTSNHQRDAMKEILPWPFPHHKQNMMTSL